MRIDSHTVPGSRGAQRELRSAAAAIVVSLAGAIAAAIAIVRADRLSLVLTGALGAVLLVSIIAQLGDRSLLIWLAVGGVLSAFVHVPSTHPIITFDRVWVGGMAILALSRWNAAGWSKTSRRLLRALLLLSLAYVVRGLYTAGGALSALEIAIDAILLPSFLFVWAAWIGREEGGVRRVLPWFVVAGTTLGALGIAETIGGFQLASLAGGVPRIDPLINAVRISGPYAVPEVYALVLVSCLAATLLWIRLKGRSAYVVGGLVVALQSAALYLTYFRAAWIAGLIVVVGCLAIRPHRGAQTAMALGLTLAVGYVAFVELRQTSTTFATRVNDTQNISGRLAGYQQGFELWRDSPVFGVGVGQYAKKVVNVPAVAVSGVEGVTDPHSSFMQVLVEQGVVGLTVFLSALATVALLIRGLARRARSLPDDMLVNTLRAAALGYLVMSLGLAMIPYGPSNAFIAVLLGLGAGRLDTLRSGEPSPDSQSSDRVR